MDSFLWESNEKRWFEAARRRVSVRRFAGHPTSEQLNTLAALAEKLSRGGVRIVVFSPEGRVFRRSFCDVGHGAAFVLSADTPDWCAGYLGEAFILECTAQELGCCWLSDTYKKKQALRAIGLREGERLRAVTPIGLPAKGTLPPVSDDDRQRRTIPKLTGLSDSAFEELPAWQRNSILCMRSAPSGRNKQPWFVRPSSGGFLLATKKTSLETGIAMFHLEVAAVAHGKHGRWSEETDGRKFSIDA